MLVEMHRNSRGRQNVKNDVFCSSVGLRLDWSPKREQQMPAFYILLLAPTLYVYIHWLVVWNMFSFSHILGMSSSQLTNIFQRD